MASSKPIQKPTKIMSWDEFHSKTDYGNKLMDRVWYCIASSDCNVSKQKVFWEHWYWKDDAANMRKDVANGQIKKASNHTLTISTDCKEVDYPIWPVKLTSKSMKMYPAIDLKCTVIAPIALPLKPIAFPTNDSRTEFRVDFCQLGSKILYFIFVLDPNISEDNKTKNYEVLEKENGILREWFTDVSWDDNYKIGSTGEPDINPR